MENYISAEEKRRYKRVGADVPLQYRDLRKSAELPKGSVLRNISEGGVCFSSKEFMSLACRLVLTITLPNNPKPLKAISKVAWIRRLPVGDQYELGNQFLEIAKEDKVTISEFVQEALDIKQ
ncbi:MAG: PilZ domain-containing protein [Candidatus Omnitrophica bacterium]|nr:PilZ domain-containing protein [Candidatus Omnitrophota bacterium]